MELFTAFPNHSKVWIYQSNRILNKDEMQFIDNEIRQFAEEWSSHGNQLSASAKVLNPYFAVIVANDDFLQPSGCSVDTLNKFMKNMGHKINIDFFNRLKVIIDNGNGMEQISFAKMKEFPNALIYDTLIENLGDLRKKWPCTIKESHFAMALK